MLQSPTIKPTYFILLFLTRIYSAFKSPIQDCDEIFNYFEPLHYFLNNSGFQTWEYCQRFALRSWAYIILHSFIMPLLPNRKVAVFYGVRLLCAVSSWLAEVYLVKKIAKFVGLEVANFTLIGLVFSAGMFIAAPAFLPSSFGMIFITLAFAESLDHNFTRQSIRRTVLSVVIAGFLGWPFCLAFGGVYVVQRVITRTFFGNLYYMISEGLIIGILSILVVAVPLWIIDSMFYKISTLAPLNLLLYNVFSGDGRGPALYGTEPWWFYISNGFLNFNLFYILALASLPLNAVSSKFGIKPIFSFLLPFYCWFMIFTLQPHKEERFMYAIFPIICFNAAVSLRTIEIMNQTMLSRFRATRRYASTTPKRVTRMIMAVFILLSVSRRHALAEFYTAPIYIFQSLSEAPPPNLSSKEWNLKMVMNGHDSQAIYSNRSLSVCMGKDWYKFPSHFLVPFGMQLEFIPSHFNGLLPTRFKAEYSVGWNNATSLKEWLSLNLHSTRDYSGEPDRINDLNLPERDRYTSISSCDYLIDTIPFELPLPAEDSVEPYYGLGDEWMEFKCKLMLDAKNTKFPQRVFYFGGKKQWVKFCLFVRAKAGSI